MPAPKGNQFWKARSKHGANPKFDSADDLWSAACEYFEWVEDNPLNEEKLFSYQGDISKGTIQKMRAMTVSGLCLFIDIDQSTWEEYRKREDLSRVCKRVDSIIYNQKFQGASADLLNPSIIARDLGLTDKQDVNTTHTFGQMTDTELENRIKTLENELKSQD